jgi:hypothetical protein
MARPREYDDRISTGMRLPRDLHARLTEEAADRDLSVNWMVTKAIAEFLDRLLPVGEIAWTRVRRELDQEDRADAD